MTYTGLLGRNGREKGTPCPNSHEVVPVQRRLRDRVHLAPPPPVAGRQREALRALQRARVPVHRHQRAALPADAAPSSRPRSRSAWPSAPSRAARPRRGICSVSAAGRVCCQSQLTCICRPRFPSASASWGASSSSAEDWPRAQSCPQEVTCSMSFSDFGLHPDLLRGVATLGFSRPTPIQQRRDSPRRWPGRDVLACAMTGSGKTAAFLLPILHRLIGKPRGHHPRARSSRRRASWPRRSTSTCSELAVHTPLPARPSSAASAWARRSTPSAAASTSSSPRPGRLLDHMQQPVRAPGRPRGPGPRRGGPDARHGLPARHPAHPEAPARRSGRRCSSPRRCRRRSRRSRGEMLQNPVTLKIERHAGARGRASPRPSIPVPQELKSALLLELLQSAANAERARLHAHQAPRQPAGRLPGEARGQRPTASTATAARRSARRRWPGSRTGATRSWSRPTSRRAGIDVEALEPRRQLRRAGRAGGLHPPRGPHRARRGDGRRLHLRLAGRGGAICAHRARDRHAGSRACACPGFDYTSARPSSPRSRMRGADRGHPRAARPRSARAPRERRAPRDPTPPAPPAPVRVKLAPGSGLTFRHNVGM